MRIPWRKILVVAAIVAVAAGGFWFVQENRNKPSTASAGKSEKNVAAVVFPAEEVKRLENALNSPEISERSMAYAPGVIRDAYKANAKSKESGGIALDAKSFKQIGERSGEVTATIPKLGRRVLVLAKVKTDAGEQWFVTATRE